MAVLEKNRYGPREVTASQAAQNLRVSREQIRKYIKDGRIRSRKEGYHTIVNWDEVVSYFSKIPYPSGVVSPSRAAMILNVSIEDVYGYMRDQKLETRAGKKDTLFVTTDSVERLKAGQN